MQYWKLALAVCAVCCATTAQAVEKTAIDKRLNAPLDVDLQSLQSFLSTLTGRLERDLGNQITQIQTDLGVYSSLVDRLEQRIQLLRANYTACPHSLVDVPNVSSYDPTRQRLVWQPGSNAWVPVPLQTWEHN